MKKDGKYQSIILISDLFSNMKNSFNDPNSFINKILKRKPEVKDNKFVPKANKQDGEMRKLLRELKKV